MVLSGLDVLIEKNFDILKGSNVGLLVNQASVDSKLRHAVDIFAKEKSFSLKALFGPQHGLDGHTQDNMIEWNGYEDEKLSLPVYSLYGEVRQPSDDMLKGIDTVVIDLPDIGARYYTFLWTSLLMLEKCCQLGIRVVVLDRPNPINGMSIEGPTLKAGFESFVGLYPIPIRHGMTMGELLFMMYKEKGLKGKFIVVTMKNWKRNMWFDDTKLPWVMPSPNMPTLDTAIVYPGMCLVEGTTISEGRGTTRPFELFGAPYFSSDVLAESLKNIDGLVFRKASFQPSFQKHAGNICFGGQLHVVDRNAFESVFTTLKIFETILKNWSDKFSWKQPPYEYEYKILPIDILFGSDEPRKALESGEKAEDLRKSWISEETEFRKRRQDFLMY